MRQVQEKEKKEAADLAMDKREAALGSPIFSTFPCRLLQSLGHLDLVPNAELR